MSDFPIEVSNDHVTVIPHRRRNFVSELALANFDATSASGGQVLDIDMTSMNIFDDSDEEEVVDEDLLSRLYHSGPRAKLCVMELDKVEQAKEQDEPFQAFSYEGLIFEEMEKEMKPLDENRAIFKEVIQRGNGTGRIPERCKIFYHFIAIAEGTNEPFDSSMARKRPFVSDLRRSDLLPGMEIALKSMEILEVARFIVYPQLAYRDLGLPPRIPPNAKIMYLVKMIRMIPEETLNTFPYLNAEERSALPFSKILEEADTRRSVGNRHYVDKSYQAAIRCYRQGVNILEDYPVAVDKEDRERSQLLWTLYSNLAQAYLKLEKPAQACNACKLGLRHARGHDCAKLYLRFAKAKFLLNDIEATLGLISEGLQHDRSNKDLLTFRTQVREEKKKRDQLYKRLCQGMFRK